MKGAYTTYFENPFASLRMDRPAYKAQAEYSLHAVTEAALGAAFTPLLAALATAIGGFDENLTDRNQSTAGGTDAYHLARTEWLAFVDDTMKDYVTPKLRKLPAYADFKKFGKSKLATQAQPKLLTDSKALVALYRTHQAALYPTLGAEAQKLYAALATTTETRDTQSATIDAAVLDLADDRAAIAHAQRRLKAQLELTFEKAEKVYSFFDFSKAESARKAQKRAAKKAAAVSPASAGAAS
ncbi:hypothetical protein ACVWYF_002794 [Hymenobacter sp. UYAg731]